MKNALSRIAIAVAVVLLLQWTLGTASTRAGVPAAPRLHLALQPDALLFRLAGRPVGFDGPWVLQSSAGLGTWEDVLFFGTSPLAGAGDLELELSIASLPQPIQGQQFFRTRYLEADDPVLREFLAGRDTWRSAGIGNYTMELRWQAGGIFWHGIVGVNDHAVVRRVTIDTNLGELPAPRTIDDWFHQLKRSIDQGPDLINVTYDAVFGYPKSVVVDESILIADDEWSLSILDFQAGL